MGQYIKRITLFLISLTLIGCSLQETNKNTITNSELMNKIKTVMPESISSELDDNVYFHKTNGTICVSNHKDSPTLRLDFTYENDKLMQYVSKEYGFIENLEDNLIDEQQALLLAKSFAFNFLNISSNFEITSTPKTYDNDHFITFKDQFNNIYVIQLTKNIIVFYSSSDYQQ